MCGNDGTGNRAFGLCDFSIDTITNNQTFIFNNITIKFENILTTPNNIINSINIQLSNKILFPDKNLLNFIKAFNGSDNIPDTIAFYSGLENFGNGIPDFFAKKMNENIIKITAIQVGDNFNLSSSGTTNISLNTTNGINILNPVDNTINLKAVKEGTSGNNIQINKSGNNIILLNDYLINGQNDIELVNRTHLINSVNTITGDIRTTTVSNNNEDLDVINYNGIAISNPEAIDILDFTVIHNNDEFIINVPISNLGIGQDIKFKYLDNNDFENIQPTNKNEIYLKTNFSGDNSNPQRNSFQTLTQDAFIGRYQKAIKYYTATGLIANNSNTLIIPESYINTNENYTNYKLEINYGLGNNVNENENLMDDYYTITEYNYSERIITINPSIIDTIISGISIISLNSINNLLIISIDPSNANTLFNITFHRKVIIENATSINNSQTAINIINNSHIITSIENGNLFTTTTFTLNDLNNINNIGTLYYGNEYVNNTSKFRIFKMNENIKGIKASLPHANKITLTSVPVKLTSLVLT